MHLCVIVTGFTLVLLLLFLHFEDGNVLFHTFVAACRQAERQGGGHDTPSHAAANRGSPSLVPATCTEMRIDPPHIYIRLRAQSGDLSGSLEQIFVCQRRPARCQFHQFRVIKVGCLLFGQGLERSSVCLAGQVPEEVRLLLDGWVRSATGRQFDPAGHCMPERKACPVVVRLSDPERSGFVFDVRSLRGGNPASCRIQFQRVASDAKFVW